MFQFLVPYLNSSNVEFRNMVSSTLEEVFRGDKKGEVSFAIVKQVKLTSPVIIIVPILGPNVFSYT